MRISFHNRNRTTDSGFTLVELMVVITIIAILAVISVPIFSKMPANYRLKGEARYLIIAFQKARLEAVRRSSTVLLKFDTANNKFEVFVDSDDDGVLDAGELIETRQMPKDVTLYHASFTGSTSTAGYNSRGMSWGLPPSLNGREGNVRIKNNNDRYYMATLTYAGNVRLEIADDDADF